MGLVLMNERDLHRVGALAEIRAGDRAIASAAVLLGLTARHSDGLSRVTGSQAPPVCYIVSVAAPRTGAARSLSARVLWRCRRPMTSVMDTLASEALQKRHG